jgi:hypothetical protein
VTSVESPPMPTKRFVAASRAVWVFAAMFLVHAATAVAAAPSGKLERLGGATIAAMVGMNVLFAVGIAWLGARVRTGKNIAAACSVIGLLGFIGLATIVGVTAGGHDQRAPVLVAVQIAFGVAWLAAMVFTARAWSSS